MKTLRAVQLDPRLTTAPYDNAADHTINRSAEPTVVVLLTKVAGNGTGNTGIVVHRDDRRLDY